MNLDIQTFIPLDHKKISPANAPAVHRKMQVVHMGKIGFTKRPDIGTYAVGPNLGLLLEFNDLYACAYFTRPQQITTSLQNMYTHLQQLGYTLTRATAFCDHGIKSLLEPLKKVFSNFELVRADSAGFRGGLLVTDPALPHRCEFEVEMELISCLTNERDYPWYLPIQFQPADLGLCGPYPNTFRLLRPTRPAAAAPVSPTTSINPRKNFLKAARKKKWL
jgi:hypothetical protein